LKTQRGSEKSAGESVAVEKVTTKSTRNPSDANSATGTSTTASSRGGSSTTGKSTDEGNSLRSDPSASSPPLPPGLEQVFGADIIFAGCSSEDNADAEGAEVVLGAGAAGSAGKGEEKVESPKKGEVGPLKAMRSTSNANIPPPPAACPPPPADYSRLLKSAVFEAAAEVNSPETSTVGASVSQDCSSDNSDLEGPKDRSESITSEKSSEAADRSDSSSSATSSTPSYGSNFRRATRLPAPRVMSPRSFQSGGSTSVSGVSGSVATNTSKDGSSAGASATSEGSLERASSSTKSWCRLTPAKVQADDGWFEVKKTTKSNTNISDPTTRTTTQSAGPHPLSAADKAQLQAADLKAREQLIVLCTKHDVDTRTVAWFLRVEHVQYWHSLVDKCAELDRRSESSVTYVKNPSAWLTKYFNTLRNYSGDAA